ncbi:hypothetical protein M8C11_18650 [Micromonospora sp. CPM1]|uniref:hypothetical protein n=1 Tax=Micromonospora sp. CPM1 TaxID=2944809 RepID=UPI00207C1421|nr:hypothetical protein [Micromonospora sp. CPM1]MCO1616736.1 hypothetical protein [Micromonospora sp. CPM1]
MSPLRRNVRRGRTEHTLILGPARLYLDDLEEIWREVSALKAPENDPLRDWQGNLTIRAGDAEADSIDDLSKASRSELDDVSLLNFKSGKPVTVRLSRRQAYVSVDSTDAEGVKLAEDIKSYIDKRRSAAVSFIAHPHYTWLGVIGSLAMLILTLMSLPQPVAMSIFMLLGFVVVASNAFIGPLQVRRLGSVRVIGHYSHDNRGFSRETKRMLVVALIAGLAGALLAGILGFWEGLFLK